MKVTKLFQIFLLGASTLSAQIQTGRIVGTVFDPNKAVVPNAAVTVTNKDTKSLQKVSTNGTGGYVVPALNPGVYDVTVAAAGFRTIVQSGIEMQVGKDLLLDFDLVLGFAGNRQTQSRQGENEEFAEN